MGGGLATGLGVGELFAQGLELLLLGAEAGLADEGGLGSGVFSHKVILPWGEELCIPHPPIKIAG